MTKKFISLFLSFALVFSLLGTTAFAAANDLEIEGDTVVCENAPGSEISYHVNLKTNPGFTSGKIAVSWDGTALKLKEVVYSAYPNASSPPIPAGASSYAVSFGNDLNTEDYTTTGPAFEMKFEILSGAVSKKYDLTIAADAGDFPGIDIVDPKVKAVVITNGSITLREKLTGNLTVDITKPVKGGTPETTITGTNYTGSITWDPAVASGEKFAANTAYTAKVTLTANTGYQFASGVNPTVTDATISDKNVSSDGSKLEFKATFPKTNDKDPASVTTAPTAKTLTYTGSAQELVTAGSGVTGGTLKYRLGESGAWSTDIPKATDAGEYAVYYMVEGDTDHSSTAPVKIPVTIGKKPITPTITVTGSYEYTGNPITPAFTVEDSGTELASTHYTAEVTNNVNAGTGTITVKEAANSNYTFAQVQQSFTIGQKSHGNETASGSARYGAEGTVDLSSYIVPGGTATYASKTDSDSVLVGDPSLDGGVLKFKFVDNSGKVGKSATATINITSTNYTDYAITVTLDVTDKVTPTVTAPTAKALTYNGAEQVLINAGSTTGGELQYSLTSGIGYSTELPKAKDANSYNVYYKIVGNAEYANVAENHITVTIGKKAVTVAPKAFTITKGSAIPAFELAYTGLVSGESLTPSATPIFTCYETGTTTPVSTSTAAGTYTITWTNEGTTTFTGADNYDVTKTATATLTISNPSYSGGGSYTPSYTVSVDKTENGTITVSPKSASKGDTVTITVKPDKGYELEMLKALDKNGDALKLTEKNGKYTFTMPAGKVTVKGSFVEEVLFDDVKVGDYFYEAVRWAVKGGITNGVGNDLFAPNQPCTRGQIVTFLWRAAGSPTPKNMSSFADVPADAFYAKAVAWAVENGITGGTGDGKFSPDATCTRAQAVTFLYRASGAPAVSGNAEFGDVATNAYYADAVAWAAKNGITGGIGGGLFGSGNDCTRAQIVTFLYRSVK